MCDPFTAISAGLSIAGGAAKAFGAADGAKAKAENYVAQAQYSQLEATGFEQRSEVASSNFDLLRTQAETARLNIPIVEAKGRLQEYRLRYAGDKLEQQQQLHFAYSNIDPSFGSPLVLAGKTAADLEADIGLNRASTEIAKAGAMTGVANIEAQAMGAAEQAVTSRQNALLSLKRVGVFANNVGSALSAGRIGAGAALLSGFAGAMPSFAKMSTGFSTAGGNSFLAMQPTDI